MARRNIDRQALRQQIQELDIDNELKSQLLDAVSEQKKYGLVWENHKEDAEELLREKIPVLQEEAPLRLSPGGESSPNHILIEGDNLHALTALTYTHEGMVDVIYIDPPYNTGNKDFVYNDSFVDSEDGYRHSKWLSFMEKRLRIAKKLLSDRGVIFISIDDNEQANLKLLCDEVFGELSFVACTARRRRKSQANLSKNISPIHEYVLIYKPNPEFELNKIEAKIDYSEYKNPDNDHRGPYKTMPCTNKGGTKYSVVSPVGDVIEDEWRFKEDTYYSLLRDNRLVFPRGGHGKPRYKLFLNEKKQGGVIDNTWWENYGSNQEGAVVLKEILGVDIFNNPKPVALIQHILKLGSSQTSLILDFFAGSGTTLHATMQLNAEDGGHRQCILVTNNENNICRDVTYERNKRVINGYTTPKGVEVEGLKENNLRYYKVDFVERENTSANRKRLMQLSTDLLCIKENIYNEVSFTIDGKKMKKDFVRYFKEGGRQMMIIYDPRAVSFVAKALPLGGDGGDMLRVYVYSDGQYAYNDEFRGLNVELCALPDAIYQALNRVLPTPLLSPLGDDEIPSGDIIMTDNETIKNTSPRGGQEGTL